MAAIKYWVWLSALDLRPRTKLVLLDRFHGDPMELYYSTDAELRDVDGVTAGDLARMGRRELDTAMDILARCEAWGITILTMQDAAYPKRLQNIYDPPVVLYGKGRLPVMDEEAAIAVVGTREPTPYGVKMAQRLGYELTKCGGLVVSGLTRGIDRLGAVGALRAGGRVVGVLGTGLDAGSGGIYDDVAAVGALLSEYPPGAKVQKSNYRLRNRITAGLSVGVAVVEAPEHSGALLFADEALEQGKEVFSVPGNVDAPNSVGTNRLIQEGAKPVENGWNILSEYTGLFPGKLREYTDKTPEQMPEKPGPYADFVKVREPAAKKVIDKKKSEEYKYNDLGKQLEGLTAAQLTIVGALTVPSMHIDDVIEATGLDARTVLSELTMLEIEGMVRQEPGKRFTLNVIRG